MTSSKAGTSGRRGPKARSGCRTCKIRKVKCNEDRPACHQCVSSGRTCDGYGIWGGGERRPYHFQSKPDPSTVTTAGFSSSSKVAISRLHGRSRSMKEGRPRKSRATQLSPTCNVADKSCVQVTLIPTQSLISSSSQQGPVLQSIPASLAEFPAPPKERRLLYWFQQYTAKKLPGLFLSPFWGSLLPQVSYSEPAVLHALLALTSAHKYKQPELILSNEEQFTLQSYNQAIRYLGPHFGLKSAASLRVALIACVLFVCLEIVQEHYVTAISHLSNGVRLFELYKLSYGVTDVETYFNHGADNLIAQMFLKLALQVNMLENSRVPVIDGFIANIPTGRFICIGDARQCLDNLLTRVFEFHHMCRNKELPSGVCSTLVADQKSLQKDLNSWIEIFNTSSLEDEATSPPSKTSCMILRMYYTMAIIMTETGLTPYEETTFDQYWFHFLSILSYVIYSQRIMRPVSLAHNPSTGLAGMQASVIDIGWIPVLYYAAIKCRIRRIRLHAIKLLDATIHREGFWNAKVAADVAREVMRIEEGAEYGCLDGNDFGIEDIPVPEEFSLLPTVPESQRVLDVKIVLPDGPQEGSILMCRRRDGDEWKHIWREFDTNLGAWVDVVPCLT